jgi:2-methylcitrate dehydratase
MEEGFGRGMSPTRVTLKTGSGETYSAEVGIPKGHPQNPMTEQEFEDKFRDCAAHALKQISGEKVKQAMEMLRDLENIGNVADIVKLLV